MKWIFVLYACFLLCGCVGQQENSSAISPPPVGIDRQSGTSIYLDENAQILTAKSKNGKTLWSVDVIKECGTPEVGELKTSIDRSGSGSVGEASDRGKCRSEFTSWPGPPTTLPTYR